MADISLQHLDLSKISQITIKFVDDPSNAGARLKEATLLIHTYIQKDKETKKHTKETKKNFLPPISLAAQDYPLNFLILWTLHPNGVKKQAYRVFRRINPNGILLAKMLASIKDWKATAHWRQGYALNLRTWLNNEGWESPKQPTSGFDL